MACIIYLWDNTNLEKPYKWKILKEKEVEQKEHRHRAEMQHKIKHFEACIGRYWK